MSSSSLEERRRLFAKYKEDVKTRGKSFFPNAMFHDTVMSLVVIVIIIVLAIVWHETADGTKAGLLGKEYDDKADSGTFSFVPRPDWYFYFLFYLLRVFKWPDSVILGTVGIPTIGLVLLLALPFFDRRTERRLTHRPVAVVAAILVVISMARADLEGRDRDRVARQREHQEGADVDQAEQPAAACSPRRDPVRQDRLPQLPQLPRHGRRLRGCARPLGRGREEQGHRLPGRPPQVSVVREPRLADAAVLGSRQCAGSCRSRPSWKPPRAGNSRETSSPVATGDDLPRSPGFARV